MKIQVVWMMSSLVLPSLVLAEGRDRTVDYYPLEKVRIENPRSGCEENDTCALEWVEFETVRYRANLLRGQKNYGIRLHARFRTQEVDQLDDYVFVQWIQGCMFSSEFKDGQVKYYRDISTQSFNDLVSFHYPEMVLDSMDADPVYNSQEPVADAPEAVRHFWYRHNTRSGSYRDSSEAYFGESTPTVPELYVRDLPSSTFLDTESSKMYAQNQSLKFKTCLYKASDIPIQVADATWSPSVEPITCFEWQNHHVYNYETQEFDRLEEIHPFCR